MSKGGGSSTAGMERAAAQSNELQKQMYEEGVERGQPWYDAGTQGLSTLMDYMGLQGGSQKSQQQMYDSLMPQYTSEQTTTSGQQGMYQDRDGNVRFFSPEQIDQYRDPSTLNAGEYQDTLTAFTGRPEHEGGVSYSPVSTTQTTDVTDQAGLNAAVKAQMDAQTAAGTPEGFGSLMQSFGDDQFKEDAGYQFRLDEGNKAIERQLAAQGKTYSPEAAKALMGYNQGMGSQEYANAYSRYNADQGNIYNRLAGISGMGQQEVAGANALGTNYAGQVGQTNASLANAQAAAQQSKGSMFGDLMSLGGLGVKAFGAGVFSDRDLKHNIVDAGVSNGHKLYEFSYKGDDKRYVGVMAQDIVKYRPDAVCMIGGSYAVDYGRLGLEMKEVA